MALQAVAFAFSSDCRKYFGRAQGIFDEFNRKYAGEPVAVLSKAIDNASSLADLDVAIEQFSNASPCQILQFGIFKIDDAIIREIIYSRPVEGSDVSAADFDDALRQMVVGEALALMAPFDLLHHEFHTCDTGHFYELRETAASLDLDGVIVIPYRHENTISMVIICMHREEFIANISTILSSLFFLISKTFSRFPTLAKWPDEYRLTEREAQILQISSKGSLEKGVANELGISVNTVRVHIENAKRKLAARSKAHAIVIATHIGEINAMTDQTRRK